MPSKKLFNPPFLILKVRHPAVTKVFEVYCIVRDSRSRCSKDFKCMYMHTALPKPPPTAHSQ